MNLQRSLIRTTASVAFDDRGANIGARCLQSSTKWRQQLVAASRHFNTTNRGQAVNIEEGVVYDEHSVIATFIVTSPPPTKPDPSLFLRWIRTYNPALLGPEYGAESSTANGCGLRETPSANEGISLSSDLDGAVTGDAGQLEPETPTANPTPAPASGSALGCPSANDGLSGDLHQPGAAVTTLSDQPLAPFELEAPGEDAPNDADGNGETSSVEYVLFDEHIEVTPLSLASEDAGPAVAHRVEAFVESAEQAHIVDYEGTLFCVIVDGNPSTDQLRDAIENGDHEGAAVFVSLLTRL